MLAAGLAIQFPPKFVSSLNPLLGRFVIGNSK
jgi:hypothetical protein